MGRRGLPGWPAGCRPTWPLPPWPTTSAPPRAGWPCSAPPLTASSTPARKQRRRMSTGPLHFGGAGSRLCW
eukprot:11241893-Alexandrium_andersonii.AAC.1